MVEGQSVSLLSAQYHLVSDGKQWRFLDVPRIVFSHPRSYSNNSCFSVYFQLLLLFVMLLCCYPCEHGSLPEQNAKRELAIPDVATTGSLLRKQKIQSFDCIELASFDQILKIDIAILSENEIRFNFSEPIRESYKTSSYLLEIFNVQKNHDSLSGWVVFLCMRIEYLLKSVQKLLLLVRVTSSISVGDENAIAYRSKNTENDTLFLSVRQEINAKFVQVVVQLVRCLLSAPIFGLCSVLCLYAFLCVSGCAWFCAKRMSLSKATSRP
ncbi:hypothetical protein T02_11320 [Trichinella nativa]|uniref:Uncharacterized protein n=1 Tax=Trichinella nativa TaxID=6335 RepID=A0A0V1L7R7_9BILA|nr:hypothetical protein T02_11320 [Trichinella nativa]